MGPRAPSAFAFVVGDRVLLRRLEALARDHGAGVTHVSSVDALDRSGAPAVIVVELELPGAVDAIARWRARWPDCLVVGSIAVPRQDLWAAGLASGCTFVANRGAVDRQLRERLAGTTGTPRRLRVTLDERRSHGLVGNLPDAPGGPIVVVRVGERLYAIDDTCPHARTSLADGELDGAVLTCPAHGSRFDVTSGARIRGPSDFPIRTYRVVEADGTVWVELPGP